MSKATWATYFHQEELTDRSTLLFEEGVYKTATRDVRGDTNIEIQSRFTEFESYVLPSEAYLLVKYHIVKEVDDSTYGEEDNIALLNNWSLFNRAELYYNNVLMETVDHPGTVTQILGLLEDPNDYEAKGSLEYRFYDTTKEDTWVARAHKNGTLTESTTKSAGIVTGDYPAITVAYNDDAAKIAKYIAMHRVVEKNKDYQNDGQLARIINAPPEEMGMAGGKYIKLKLSDIFGVCKIQKPLRALQIDLRLIKETEGGNIALLRGPTTGEPPDPNDDDIADPQFGIQLTDIGKLIISRVQLVMPSVKPNRNVFEDITNKIAQGMEIPLDYNRIWCKVTEDLVAGNSSISHSYRLLSNTKRPRHLFIAFQNSKRRNPGLDDDLKQTQNSLVFDLPTVMKAQVQIGTKYYPAVEYNSSEDGFVRPYNAFLNATGKNFDALASSFVDFDRWKNVYPIYYFDLSHNDNNYEVTMDSEIVVDVTFSYAGQDDYPDNVKMIALVISDEHKRIKDEGKTILISTVDPEIEKNTV